MNTLQLARRALPGGGWAMKINGLSEITARFDAMLIDQYGVIHDGQTLYPGSLHVLSNLARLKLPVVIMTNSGKRAKANCERIIRMGVPRAHFVDVISSGEALYRSLAAKKVFLIGRDGEDYGLDGVTITNDARRADVMLILGSNAPQYTLADYRKLFKSITLPAICGNPDRQMLTPQGMQPAPGAIAALYEEMGGKVTWIGKPYAAIYQSACELAGNPGRVLCIGDSAEHDVAGGRAAGLSTLLVMQGVSAGLDAGMAKPEPDYWMESFQW